MTDTRQRPLSAEVADRFTKASQERSKALVGDERATGVVVEPKNYEVRYETRTGWRVLESLGVCPFRSAFLVYLDLREQYPRLHLRLQSRPVGDWTVEVDQYPDV